MKIILIGFGKMGKTIAALAPQRGHEIVATVDELSDKNWLSIPADVAIEFTQPSAAVHNLYRCFERGLPVVCGTTGWLEALPEVTQHCTKHGGAMVYASNFSIGVNLFFKINAYLAQLMAVHPAYQVLVSETHHTEKKDAPSGTAITLAEGILKNYPAKQKWVNAPTEQPDELAILSQRIAGVPGTHEVIYNSPIDSLTLTHTAHTREGFAWGALLAAEWIAGKKGVFTMQHVLAL